MKRHSFIHRLEDLKELHVICADTPKIEHRYDEYTIFPEIRELIRQFPHDQRECLYDTYFHPSSTSFIQRENVKNISFKQLDQTNDTSIFTFHINFIEEGTFLFTFSVNEAHQLVSAAFKSLFDEFYEELAINKKIISLFLFVLQKERLRLVVTNVPLKALILEQNIQLIL